MKSIYFRQGYWKTLSLSEQKQVKNLSLRKKGSFGDAVGADPPYIIRAFNKGKLIGWAAFFSHNNEIHTYIRKNERRNYITMWLFNYIPRGV